MKEKFKDNNPVKKTVNTASLDKEDNIFKELREAHWENKKMIDREMLTKYPEVLDKRLSKYDSFVKDLVKINYPADEIEQIKLDLDDIKKLRKDYDQVWGLDKQDMEEAKQVKKQINTKLAEIEVINQMLNFEKSKEDWLDFYKKYSIDASSLANIKLTKEGIKTQREMAEKYGFDKMVMIPAGVSPENLIANKKFAEFAGGKPDDQNTGKNGVIECYDNIDESDYWKEVSKQPQVIFLKNKGRVDSEEDETMQELKKTDETKTEDEKILKKGDTTRGYKYPEIINMEEELDLGGLDFVSAMILDREYFDEHECHLFDYCRVNVTWLTRNIEKSGHAASLNWFPGDRQWRVYLNGALHCLGRLGSVFTCSLETIRL